MSLQPSPETSHPLYGTFLPRKEVILQALREKRLSLEGPARDAFDKLLVFLETVPPKEIDFAISALRLALGNLTKNGTDPEVPPKVIGGTPEESRIYYEEKDPQAYQNSIWEQTQIEQKKNPSKEEEGVAFSERNKRWGNLGILKKLAQKLFRDSLEHLLGDIRARVKERSVIEISQFLNEKGELKVPINNKTNADILLEVIAATDDLPPEDDSIASAVRDKAASVLISRYITADSLVAEKCKKFLKARHYQDILRKIPYELEGTIGGKSTGLFIAYAILESQSACFSKFDNDFIDRHLKIAERDRNNPVFVQRKKEEFRQKFIEPLSKILQPNTSFFLGSDMFFDVIDHNADETTPLPKGNLALTSIYKQKYNKAKSFEEKQALYQALEAEVMQAQFPPHIIDSLKYIHKQIGNRPFIVRSSSLLEDNSRAGFSGQYESVEVPNSGSPEENFQAFLEALKKVYLSMYSVKAMEYRKEKDLLKLEEQMGFLVQVYNGECREYNGHTIFAPFLAGVSMSNMPLAFNEETKSEQGGFNIAVGSGRTTVGGEENPTQATFRACWYSKPGVWLNQQADYQQNAWVIDLTDKEMKQIPLAEMRSYFTPDEFSLVFSEHGGGRDGNFSFSAAKLENWEGAKTHRTDLMGDGKELAITFETLIQKTEFPVIMDYITQKLKFALGTEVDIEFTVSYTKDFGFKINIVQCRPQNLSPHLKRAQMPSSVPQERVILGTEKSLGSGNKKNISSLVYVDPQAYQELPHDKRREVQHWISKINDKLTKDNYLLLVGGRLGTSSPDVGLPIQPYAYSKAAGTIEISSSAISSISFGSHNAQIEYEAGRLNMAVDTNSEKDIFNGDFFGEQAENSLTALLADQNIPDSIRTCLKVIDVEKTWGKISGDSQTPWRLHMAQDNQTKKGHVYIAAKDQDLPESGKEIKKEEAEKMTTQETSPPNESLKPRGEVVSYYTRSYE